jgi:hypothetical protein
VEHKGRFALLLTIGLGGCAAVVLGTPRPYEERLERGVTALLSADYQAAYDDLAWVAATCPATEPGDQALLALLALELDPRNAQARPEVAADLAARRLTAGGNSWVLPVVETFYLLALDLGAPPVQRTPVGVPTPAPDQADPPATPARLPGAEPTEGTLYCPAERVAGAPRPVPRHPGTPLASRLATARRDGQQDAERADLLERELAEARRAFEEQSAELVRLEQELARIRRTLRP